MKYQRKSKNVTLNYYLTFDKRTKTPKGLLKLYIRSQSNTFIHSLGIKLNRKQWNYEKQRPKKSHPEYYELNKYLDTLESELRKFILEFRTNNLKFSFLELKNEIIKKFIQENQTDFFGVYEKYLKIKATELQENTLKKYKTIKNHLLDFQNYRKKDISFHIMDVLFFEELVNYLTTQKKLSQNTTFKMFGLMKTFLNWCKERDIATVESIFKLKLKQYGTEAIALTEKELMTLYKLELGNEKLAKVRDIFCFSCFTGQRFSDVSNIQINDVKGDIWTLRVQKTKDLIKVPLNQFAKEILSKYIDKGESLPKLSNQKANNYLKELGEYAGMNQLEKKTKYIGSQKITEEFKRYELITTHTARRTFTTLSLEKGMRQETVMRITGHKDQKTLKKYIKLTDKVTEAEMKQIWNEPKLKLVK